LLFRPIKTKETGSKSDLQRIRFFKSLYLLSNYFGKFAIVTGHEEAIEGRMNSCAAPDKFALFLTKLSAGYKDDGQRNLRN